MSASSPSAQLLHASTVASEGRAVLIIGPSGSGKSDLALRLLDRAFTLVSDDQTLVRRDGDRLLASAPPRIGGMLEVRGIGIVEMNYVQDVPVGLIVDLSGEVERVPSEASTRELLGHAIPVVKIDAAAASAPSKLALALDRLGLKL